MVTLQAVASESLTETVDEIGEAVDRLEQLLPARDENAAVLDFLEDDLREGLEAAAEVEAHFTEILEVLRSDEVSPRALVDAAEDFRVLNRLEYLMVVVAQLRRRMCQAAGRVEERRGART